MSSDGPSLLIPKPQLPQELKPEKVHAAIIRLGTVVFGTVFTWAAETEEKRRNKKALKFMIGKKSLG